MAGTQTKPVIIASPGILGNVGDLVGSEAVGLTAIKTWANSDVVALGAALSGNITVGTLSSKSHVTGVWIVLDGAAASGKKATGTITLTGLSVADEVFAVGAQTFTWKATRSGTGEVTIGATAAESCTNIITAVNNDTANVVPTQGSGTTVTITAAVAGTAGNSLALTESSTNLTVSGSGTLSGGEDLTTLTVSCGRAGSTYLDYIVASSAKAVSGTVYGDAHAERGTNMDDYTGDLPSYSVTTPIYLQFVAVGTNLENVVSSSGRVIMCYEILP